MKKIILGAAYCLIPHIPCMAADAVKVQPPAQKTLAAANGRFVLGQISEYRSDQYLLDTQTGRVWRIVSHTPTDQDGKPIPGAQPRDVLQALRYVDREGRMSSAPLPDLTPDDVLEIELNARQKK
jgi:hypothetical protein